MYLPPLISKIFYAVILSSLRSQLSSSQPKAALLQNKSSYRRTASMVHLLDSLIPGIANRSSHWIYKDSFFPWRPVRTELIASGTGTAVFKLSCPDGEKVLRIYRRSLGKSLDGLVEIAAYYKSNYQTMLRWYGGAPGLVLPMEFLVLHGPSLVGPVAASLQPYIHGQKHDLFEDYSDNEFLRLLEKNIHLRGQFLFFASQTLRQWQGQKMCFDLLGRENIMVVNQGGRYRLRISDYGIFKFDRLRKKHIGIMTRVEQRIKRLISLYELAQDI